LRFLFFVTSFHNNIIEISLTRWHKYYDHGLKKPRAYLYILFGQRWARNLVYRYNNTNCRCSHNNRLDKYSDHLFCIRFRRRKHSLLDYALDPRDTHTWRTLRCLHTLRLYKFPELPHTRQCLKNTSTIKTVCRLQCVSF